MIKDIGEVEIGIKTGADPIFLVQEWNSAEEDKPELMRRLIGSASSEQYFASNNNHKYVLYPHISEDGKTRAVDLDKYPKAKKYLEACKSTLIKRSFLKGKTLRKWFELHMPKDANAWNRKKIVIRDISDKPLFWLDETGAVVDGNCYWINIKKDVDDDLLYLILGIANSPVIEKFYDFTMNNRLFSGKRRYMTQYVENFPIPDPSAEEAKEIVALVNNSIETSSLANKKRIDHLVSLIFEEQPTEATRANSGRLFPSPFMARKSLDPLSG